MLAVVREKRSWFVRYLIDGGLVLCCMVLWNLR